MLSLVKSAAVGTTSDRIIAFASGIPFDNGLVQAIQAILAPERTTKGKSPLCRPGILAPCQECWPENGYVSLMPSFLHGVQREVQRKPTDPEGITPSRPHRLRHSKRAWRLRRPDTPLRFTPRSHCGEAVWPRPGVRMGAQRKAEDG